jgi:hypothetical protein
MLAPLLFIVVVQLPLRIPLLLDVSHVEIAFDKHLGIKESR